MNAFEPAAAPLTGRRLYLCVPDRPDLASFVASCIEGGVDLVQLREKHLEARDLLERARVVRDVCRDHGVPFLLNDRPDLALEIDADGVHVGQDDAPPALARRIVGPDKIIGFSTHSLFELAAAAREPIDYVSAGPVVATPTKPGRKATGTTYITEAAASCANWPGRSAPIPFFVTGGVTPETIPGLALAGASAFVVVRYLTEASDPRKAARALTDAIARALEAPAPA